MFTNIVDRRIRIAVVGCGRISKNHFNAIKLHNEDFDLVGVCDKNIISMENLDCEESIKRYVDLDHMLTESKPDLLSICTPSGMHPEQTILAAQHGVHVMTEKPMATRWKRWTQNGAVV